MADRTPFPRSGIVALALGGLGVLGFGLWQLQERNGAAADLEAGRGAGPGVELTDAGGAGAEAGGAGARADAAGSEVAERFLLRGRVDPGLASEEPLGPLRVLAFGRALESGELFGFEALGSGETLDEELPEHVLEPARYAWEDELARLAPEAVAEVGADGRFEIAAPVRFGVVHLALVGDRVQSPGTQRIEVEAEGEAVLRGRLGALLEGRLIPDPSVGQLDLTEWTVTLERGFTGSIDMMSASADLFDRRVEVRSDGRFRLRGFPLEGRFDLLAIGPGAGPGQARGIEFAPGRTVRADLVLSTGARVEGRVTDAAGDPIPGAEVQLVRSAVLAGELEGLAPASTDDYGRFEIVHGLTGRVQVVARAEGYLPRRLTLAEELRSGSSADVQWLKLERGRSLSGLVRFVDGVPAADVEIEVELPAATRAGLQGFGAQDAGGGEFRSDADGRFEVAGLADYEFDVTAVWEAPDGAIWRGRAEAVEPGEQAMELLLEPTGAIEGRVLSAEGASVPEFELTARRSTAPGGSKNPFEISGRTEMRSVRDADGAFEFGGLGPGEWELRVEAPGFTSSDWLAVELPAAGPLEVRLEDSAVAEGRVLDPLGNPVAGARVELVQSVGERLQRLRSSGLRYALTDSAGAFRFELDAGEGALRAQAPGFGMSEEVAVDLAAGARQAGLALRLSEPGQVTGEVFGELGEPLRGAMVSLQRLPKFDTSLTARVDDGGNFRFDPVTAGRYQLLVVPSRDESPTDLAGILSGLLIDTVEVRERETVHRVLGGSVENSVEVTGRVWLAGEPVEGALLTWLPSSDGGPVSRQLTTTDAEGRYALELSRPGAFQVLIQATDGRSLSQSNTSFARRISASDAPGDVDFELPRGRVAGRVIDVAGEPAPKCRVTLHPGGGAVVGDVLGHGFVEVLTEADGTFEIEFLEPGDYRLVAGGRPVLAVIEDSAVPARSAPLELRLEAAEERDDLLLELPPAVPLAGVVLDADGAGVGGADLFVRDAAGRPVDRLSLGRTTASGRFELAGLGPGEYRVSARLGDFTTAAGVPVRLDVGESTEVELRLVRGVRLAVEVLDLGAEEGRSAFDADVRLSVVDEAGLEASTQITLDELYEAYSAGFAESSRLLGPLPPGRYRVTATAGDGRTKSKTVVLDDQELRSLKLRLR